jgi:WD40 repeat protein
VRVGKSIKSIYGPHVAGDSIDYSNGELLIGCYAAKNQIQVWDYASFKEKQSLTWTSIEDKDKVAYVYSCCFSPQGNSTILAGSCGINEIKVYNRTEVGGRFKESFRLHGIKNGVFSVDHSWKKK